MNAVANLSRLWNMELVGKEVESFRTAMAGGEGFSEAQATRLVVWGERWLSLHEPIKEFYANNYETITVGHALYCFLEQKKMLAWQYESLKREYENIYGYSPQIELVPKR